MKHDTHKRTISSKVKFIYITEVDLSINNGPGINEREFINALRKNYESEVICIVPYPAHPEIHYDSGLEYVISHRHYHPIFYWIHLLSTFYRVLRLHKQYHFSGLIFRLGEIPLVPLLLSHILKVPLILKTLAGYSTFSEKLGMKRKLFNRFLLPLYRTTIQRALISDTVSIPYMDWLRFKFGVPKDRISLVPNGVNIDFFSPGDRIGSRRKLDLDHFEHIVGYVGAITKLRHLDMLISSFKIIKNRNNIGVVIVGDGANRDALEALTIEQGIAKHVIFTGFVPYTTIPEYMRTFDVAVDLTLVSMEIENKVLYASYSQKIPQYLACGIPVVAWDVVDNQFLKREGIGKVVPFGDCMELAKSIQQLLNLKADEMNALRQRALNYAEINLSISRLTNKRIHLWQSVLDSKYKN